jgi:hypothetical protein
MNYSRKGVSLPDGRHNGVAQGLDPLHNGILRGAELFHLLRHHGLLLTLLFITVLFCTTGGRVSTELCSNFVFY